MVEKCFSCKQDIWMYPCKYCHACSQKLFGGCEDCYERNTCEWFDDTIKTSIKKKEDRNEIK